MDYQTVSAFVQDEIHLFDDQLLLTAGVKIQRDVLAGFQTQPTVRALWAPTSRHSAWVSASRAVRTPTFYELAVLLYGAETPGSPSTLGLPVVFTLNGSPTFQPEITKDYELGYRAQLSPALSLDLTGFYTHDDGRQTAAPGSLSLVLGTSPYILLPYALTNFGVAHSEGGEAAISYNPVSRWKLAASYSYLNVHQTLSSTAPEGTSSNPSATPAHQVKLQSYWNINKSLELDTHLFYSSAFESLSQAVLTAITPAHLRADLRLGWRIKPGWELSIAGQDLGSRRTLELPPEVLAPINYTSRGFYVKSTWGF